MLKFELQKAADKLINEIFAVKKGETVVITADTMSDEGLVEAVAASVYSIGGFPMAVSYTHLYVFLRLWQPHAFCQLHPQYQISSAADAAHAYGDFLCGVIGKWIARAYLQSVYSGNFHHGLCRL